MVIGKLSKECKLESDIEDVLLDFNRLECIDNTDLQGMATIKAKYIIDRVRGNLKWYAKNAEKH